MLLNVTVTRTTTGTGSPRNVAKAQGKQRTVPVDLSKSDAANFGAAAGVLLADLLTPVQRAKMLHPTGRQRFTMESLSDAGGKVQFLLDV